MIYTFERYDFLGNRRAPDYDDLQGKAIVVFGASHIGMLAKHALDKRGIKTACFCDNNKDKQNACFCGLPVVSPDELPNLYPGAEIFNSSIYFAGIEAQLKELGYSRIHYCADLLQGIEIGEMFPVSTELLVRAIDTYMNTFLVWCKPDYLSLHSVDLVVTEKCTLKCRDCANLMQYYQHPKDGDADELMTAISAILQAVDYVHELRVIGGEPFIHKKLRDILAKIATFDNYSRIMIYTNGTIVPPNAVFSGYDTSRIEVVIADYGDLSRNMAKLRDSLEAASIKYGVVSFDKWTDCGTIKYRERTETEKKHIYYNCCAKATLTLLHGILYSCPFSANARNLRAIPAQPAGGPDEIACNSPEIDIDELRNRIKKLYLETEYLHACDFCNGRDYAATVIPAAIQTKTPLAYDEVY
jgi:organic radical activating enzyme